MTTCIYESRSDNHTIPTYFKSRIIPITLVSSEIAIICQQVPHFSMYQGYFYKILSQKFLEKFP